MPISTTPVLAWRWWGGCWRRRASASASLPSRTGRSAEPFKALGKPNLYFGVTAGNMDSMVNRYTAERKIRSDDAYTPGGEGGKRPDRAVLVYSSRCREAYPDAALVIGSIEASLRRIAHYDYWSDKVRRSMLVDSKADILLYGNAERALVALTHRLAKGEKIGDITDLRGTAFMRKDLPEGWLEVDSAEMDRPGHIQPHPDPYAMEPAGQPCAAVAEQAADTHVVQFQRKPKVDRAHTVVRLPSYEQVSTDPVMYAHASSVLHLESNPGNARALVQRHGDRDVWLNPPPIPLTTKEMDYVYDLPYARAPHPAYQGAKIPAWEMIRFSVNIMRGCFGGCTFCSITEHEGRIIQNRSEQSILHEIEEIRDKVEGFTGVVSDLGGPTANMYRMACKSPKIESACRKLSCVYPDICDNLNTDHSALIQLYQESAPDQGREENPDRLGIKVRPGRQVAGIRQGTGHPPRRRLPQDRPRAQRGRPAVQDDEAWHGRLRPLQANVREVF